MTQETLLMVADSERDANMLYAVRMFVPDPFIYLRIRGRDYIVMSDLEIDRARKQAAHCRVIPLSKYQDRLRRHGVKQPGPGKVLALLLRERKVRRVVVPTNFPLGLANDLIAAGVKVKPRKGSFFPVRERKSPDEVKKISAALAMAEVGLAEGIQALKTARIGKDRRLIYQNAPLTSERLRAIIDSAILRLNGLASHTIVAGGRQACDPHEPGHGLLRAHEPIILDVFPRSQKTGYFGDITRTVVKGRASEGVRRLYDTVRGAQKVAFSRMRKGVRAKDVHQAVQEFLAREGYKTGRQDGRMEGFFHGTGHGVGLEIHEAPRIGPYAADVLEVGQVVTVEPGLYYAELGGVRLEDMVVISGNGPRNLTRFEKVLEI
jgi:Xaa-Pro aminopeptidase